MGKKITEYDLIKQRKFNEALELANEKYKLTKVEVTLRHRAMIYLCLKDYSNALNDCLKLISTSKYSCDLDFVLAGISYWFLDQQTESINIWEKGLKAQYVDAAGGVTIPAVLYFASVELNDDKLQNKAIKLLQKKWRAPKDWKSPSIANWPGPIAGYLLDEISEDTMFNEISDIPILRERHLCQANFYKAVKFLKARDKMGYITYLAESMSHFAYLESEHYLAEGELDKNRDYEPSVDDFLNSDPI